MIAVNWIIFGLNWIVSLKCLEMTFVVIWRYINKMYNNVRRKTNIQSNADDTFYFNVTIKETEIYTL